MKKIFMGFVTFVIICFAIWFQINFLNSIPLAGVNANFGIVLVAGLGLICGKFVGGLSGGVYGLLLDIVLGRSVGIYLGLYALVGILSGFLNKGFSKGNKVSMIMIVSIATAVFEAILYLLNIMLNRYSLDFGVLINVLVLESAYNILLTIIFFNAIAFLGDILNRCKNSFYLL